MFRSRSGVVVDPVGHSFLMGFVYLDPNHSQADGTSNNGSRSLALDKTSLEDLKLMVSDDAALSMSVGLY